MKRWHPWRAVGERPDVTVLFGDPGPGCLGRVEYETATITLCPTLLQAERRSTLTHELIHLDRGPAPAGHDDREEREVARLAAERLITMPELISAVQWSDHVDEQAFDLWVDEDTVQVRLRHLSDAERLELARVRASRDPGHHADDHHVDQGAS